MEESLNYVIELEKKLEEILPYIKESKVSKIVKWAQEDIIEMEKIKKELTEREMWEKDKLLKNKTYCKIKKKTNIEQDLIEIYKIIWNELEEWRNIYIQIVIM